MKKVLAILLMLAVTASLFAGGAENKNNMSAGYIRSPSKNTETKKPDAVFYNPAGTAFMEEGVYFEIGNQFLFKDYSNDASETPLNDEYSSTDPVLIYPNGEVVWNAGNFALFGAVGVAAGGGKAEYEDGSFTSFGAMYGTLLEGQPHSLDLSAVIFGETIGASYAFNDMISVSAAARFVQGKIKLAIELDSDPGIGTTELAETEATANGFGGIFGLHINATEDLDIALQYQTKVALEYEYDSVDGFSGFLTPMLIAEGDKYDKDLPAMLGAGAGYQILDNLYSSISFNYYFNKDASFETGVKEGENEYDNGWEIAASAEYEINDMFAVSGGALYTVVGFKDDENSAEVPLLDALTIGAGTGITFSDNLLIDIAAYKPIYFDADYTTGLGDITLSKKLFLMAVGVTYKL